MDLMDEDSHSTDSPVGDGSKSKNLTDRKDPANAIVFVNRKPPVNSNFQQWSYLNTKIYFFEG